MSGVMQISGTAERPPIKPGLNQSLYCAGINAAYASLAGYLAARRTGAGVALDLSVHETIASQLVMNAAVLRVRRERYRGDVRRLRIRSPGSPSPPPTVTCHFSRRR